MISLASNYLLFQTANGEHIPLSAETISFELMGDVVELFDPDFVRNAASAVLHYFKCDLSRQTVSVGEFADVLERVLRGFKLPPPAAAKPETGHGPLASDLAGLARECSEAGELVFFPRLREELRLRLKQGPRVLRFRGLRPCVKQLTGARRWGSRCQGVAEQIIAYLQGCLRAEARTEPLGLVIQ